MKLRIGACAASTACSKDRAFLVYGRYASLYTRSRVGLITKKVRNSDNPTMTCAGGADCVPKAWRISDNTITMRVNPVIISTIAGRNDSAVKNNNVWIGTE